jgi:hypothetical protein
LALIVGPEERDAGTVQVKPLRSAGDQRPVPLADAVAAVRRAVNERDTGVTEPTEPTLSTVSDKTVSDKTVSDRTVSDRTVSDKTVSDKTVSDKTVSDKTVSDRTVSDKTVSDKSVVDERVVDERDTGVTEPTEPTLSNAHSRRSGGGS